METSFNHCVKCHKHTVIAYCLNVCRRHYPNRSAKKASKLKPKLRNEY